MSLAPAPKQRSPSMRAGPVLGAHGVEVPDERDVRAPPVPRVTRHDDRVAVAADRRRRAAALPRRSSTASQSARSSPMGDGIAQSQRSVVGEAGPSASPSHRTRRSRAAPR